MKKEIKLKQCRIEKSGIRNGIQFKIVDVAWIPEQFAKIGQVIKLKCLDGWEDGYVVTAVHFDAECEEVRERSQDHKRQRKASDI